MIIKLIPETELEKSRATEVEIRNVREFFLMGNNITDEETLGEFHEWTGSYRSLLGSLQYYFEVINDERRESENRRKLNTSVAPTLTMLEDEDEDVQEIEQIEHINVDDENIDDEDYAGE